MGALSGKTFNGIGKTRGGWATKIHAVADARGLPLRIKIAPGNRNDNLFAKILLKGKRAKYVIADQAYDTNDIRYYLMRRKGKAVIPSQPNRIDQAHYSKRLYKKRNLIERFFQRLKSFKRIATRYEKSGRLFRGMVVVVCIMMYLIYG
jgi:transposase